MCFLQENSSSPKPKIEKAEDTREGREYSPDQPTSCRYNFSFSLTFLTLVLACATTITFLAGRFCHEVMIQKILILNAADSTMVDWKVVVSKGADATNDNEDVDEEEDHDEEEDEVTRGRQLFIDIENVDGKFLNSESRLVRSVQQYLKASDFDWESSYSWHCQQGIDDNSGYSCFFLFREGGRITLITWPIEGTVSLEVFLNDEEGCIISDLKVIESIFAVPRRRSAFGNPVESPFLRWKMKSRGFHEFRAHPDQTDLQSQIIASDRAFKQKVASTETMFQRIDIYDMIHPRLGTVGSYKRMLNEPSSYEGQHTDLFRPDRLVYLDKVLQSRFFGDAAYHEALVHPALVSHPNPQRVAIIGGGEGATLREVLKHNTVKTVTMIEIDRQMVDFSKENLPEWSDCSNLIGSSKSCFDDRRAELFCEDATNFFIERYLENDGSTEPYDVIIMDALDPDSVVEFSDVLYDNPDFVKSLSSALTEDGVMVIQSGEAASPYPREHPKEYLTGKQYGTLMVEHMKKNGFVSVKTYEEAHGGFFGVWCFLMAFKQDRTDQRWFSSQARADLDLAARSMPTKDGVSPFRYFDGATLMNYQYTSRVDAEASCLQGETVACEIERGFRHEQPQIPSTALAVHGEPYKVTIVTNAYIDSGSYVGIDTAVHAVEVSPSSGLLLQQFSRPVNEFVTRFGVPHCFHGGRTWFIDTELSPSFARNKCEQVKPNLGMNFTKEEACNKAIPMYKHTGNRDEYTLRLAWPLVANTDIPAGTALSTRWSCTTY